MLRHETNRLATQASLALVLVACAAKPAPSAETTNAQSCGQERNIHGKGRDQAARDCIERAFQEGQTKTLTITLHTIEGDPIRYDIQTHAEGIAVKLKIDSKDHFGSPGITETTCEALRQAPALKLERCKGSPDAFTIP